MPGLLTRPPTEAQRRENNRHRPLVVVAALLLLLVYAYLFTQVATPLGLPLPKQLGEQLGFNPPHFFDDDGSLWSKLKISMSDRFERGDDRRLVYFVILMAAFLSVYFLDVRHKRRAMVGWTIVALLLLFGLPITTALLLAHLVVYLVLHPGAGWRRLTGGLLGLLAWLAFVFEPQGGPSVWLLGVVLPVVGSQLHRSGIHQLLQVPRVAAIVRPLVVHFAVVFMCVAVAVDGLGGPEMWLVTGVLMFFWQWPRVALYYVDYEDGQVPADLPFPDYLAVFLNPALIPNWNWGVAIPQGYAYLDSTFLVKDKNRLIVDGIRIMGVALLYLASARLFPYLLVRLFNQLEFATHYVSTRVLVGAFMHGREISTASVLLTTFLDLFQFMVALGGVLHFKVGVWRLLGYDVAPYYDRFWRSTNLVVIWSRFAFHYREFCVRVFYYPVFFRFFRTRPMLRAFAATLSAAWLGNFLWHLTEHTGFNGFTWNALVADLITWPYFFSLGLGIAGVQVYLMKRKRQRKPWTLDRWLATDFLAAYATIQYFGLVHIFARPNAGSSAWDLTRLFLKGFGVHLD